MPDLLGRKSERGEKFDRYLHENVRQGWRRRDLGINPKPAEEALERRKQINQRVIAGADVFDRLRGLGSRRHTMRSEKGHTASRIAIPANIAFTGGDGCTMSIRKRNINECFWMY